MQHHEVATMYALSAEDLERLGLASLGLTISSQRAALRAGEELSSIGVAASGAYLMIWLGLLGRLIDARSPETVTESMQRFGDEWQRRLRHDLRLWLATVLETSDRLGTIATPSPMRTAPPRRRAAG